MERDDLPAILGGEPVRPQGPPQWPPDDPAIAEALRQALVDRSWGKYLGPHTERLRQRLAELHGCEQVVLCASGTAAVELALRGLKIGPGDEVVLAAYDFKANLVNVLTVGAMPVLVDLDPHNGNLDVEQLEAAISPATKAILVSHLHGGMVAMPRVMELARSRGLVVIEDACQMPGAVIHGRRAGTWGDVGVLSFGGSKLLSAGRGGAVLTNNADVVQRMHLYTQRGNEAYPLSELQALVLLPQLERLEERNQKRADNAARLLQLLAGQTGLRAFRNLPSDSQPGYYKLGFWYDAAAFGGLSREVLSQAMREEGIALDPGFRALHLTHSRRRFRAVGELPHTTRAETSILTLHHPVLLGDEDDLQQIVNALERVRRHAARILERLAGR